MKPYVYRVRNKITGQFYYGVQYGRNCNPNNLWVKYFTSSKPVYDLIQKHGKESFEIKIIRTFTCPVAASKFEFKIILKFLEHPLCLNIRVGYVYSEKSTISRVANMHKTKSIKDINGLTIYQKAGLKLKGIPKSEKHKKSVSNSLSVVGEDGLTVAKRRGLLITGENNPSKKYENRKKISDGNKLWYTKPENQTKIENAKLKCKETMLIIGEDGLSGYERKALNQSGENSKLYKLVWAHNNIIEDRFKENEVPFDFFRGRLPGVTKGYARKEKVCPHCSLVGKGGNMMRYHFDNCKKKDINDD